ncbi:MAG: hypothetical protein ACOX6L_02750 [Syntrophomonadaceae bacterium]|jgi:hypothetical protein
MGTRLIKGLIILVAAVLFLAGCEKTDNIPRIFEIKNTAVTSNNPQLKYIEIEKHYMILNAPANLPDLKALIDDYMVKADIEGQIPKGAKPVSIELYFYRESKRLPRDWQPEESSFFADRLEHHRDDCIGGVFWTTDSPEKIYGVARKGDDGEVLQEFNYIDDKLQPAI